MRFLFRKQYRVWIFLLFASCTAGIVAWGSDRSATPAAAGTTIAGTFSAEAVDCSTLRVATFNIHGGKGADDQRDLDRIADTLQGFDLIATQEVRGGSLVGAPDQAAILANKLDLAWLYAPAERRWWSDAFGNALLTQFPITRWKRIPLTCTKGKAYRNAVVAQVQLEQGEVHVLFTHLDRHEDREVQLREVIQLYRELPTPSILMGDLNTDRHDPLWAELLEEPAVIDVLSQGDQSADNRLRIDWIVARGLEVVDAGVKDDGASDHPCYWAELRLPGERMAVQPSETPPLQ